MEKNDAHSSTSYSGSVHSLHTEFSLKVDTLLTKTNSFYLFINHDHFLRLSWRLKL